VFKPRKDYCQFVRIEIINDKASDDKYALCGTITDKGIEKLNNLPCTLKNVIPH
jgi:hypothetical protein